VPGLATMAGSAGDRRAPPAAMIDVSSLSITRTTRSHPARGSIPLRSSGSRARSPSSAADAAIRRPARVCCQSVRSGCSSHGSGRSSSQARTMPLCRSGRVAIHPWPSPGATRARAWGMYAAKAAFAACMSPISCCPVTSSVGTLHGKTSWSTPGFLSSGSDEERADSRKRLASSLVEGTSLRPRSWESAVGTLGQPSPA
jgi:hypothetical protein